MVEDFGVPVLYCTVPFEGQIDQNIVKVYNPIIGIPWMLWQKDPLVEARLVNKVGYRTI